MFKVLDSSAKLSRDVQSSQRVFKIVHSCPELFKVVPSYREMLEAVHMQCIVVQRLQWPEGIQ